MRGSLNYIWRVAFLWRLLLFIVVILVIFSFRTLGVVLTGVLFVAASIKYNLVYDVPSLSRRLTLGFGVFAAVFSAIIAIWAFGNEGFLTKFLRDAYFFALTPSGIDSAFMLADATTNGEFDTFAKAKGLGESGRLKAKYAAAARDVPILVSVYAIISLSFLISELLLLGVVCWFVVPSPEGNVSLFENITEVWRAGDMSGLLIWSIFGLILLLLFLLLFSGSLGPFEWQVDSILTNTNMPYKPLPRVVFSQLILLGLTVSVLPRLGGLSHE